MIVGFTGTQVGMTRNQMDHLRAELKRLMADGKAPFEFHHGDCIGADAEAHEIALECGYEVVIHPPEYASKRAFCEGAASVKPPKPYLDRNHDIVNAAEVLIAAPKSLQEELRSGTWATVRYWKKTGKKGGVLLAP